ncbi:MAG: putative zinc-binding metallopeptidase [Elusimicrobia bacterium]|nr:putative zinc-binding metallopeptidase [Elusimicrobiota bacterium]
MRTFACACGNTVYFANTRCLACGKELGYLSDAVALVALEPLGEGRYKPLAYGLRTRAVRKCRNWVEHDVCNWLVDDADPSPLCRSCRLTRIIPNLAVPNNRRYWYELELNKRRMFYGLAQLRLPLVGQDEDPDHGLAFAFMSDSPERNTYFERLGGDQSVMTGHAHGLITINVAEADDASREWMRVKMDERYRTLLGHFRHEVGHYYWDRLVRDDPAARPAFDGLFGPPGDDYAAALKRYYGKGARPGWEESFITAYASAHPWEDWAETWSHYLHIRATMDTALFHGILPFGSALGHLRRREGRVGTKPENVEVPAHVDFDDLLRDWVELAVAMNGINTSMGFSHLYPFVLTPAVREKMRLVHRVVEAAGAPASAG